MPIIYINTGTSANSGDGDSLRTAFHKINQSLAYLQGEYVQRGVSSVNNKSGAVVLDNSDIENALGYVAYSEENPANYVNSAYLIANSYITTASIVAFNYITLGDVATYLSQNQYVDEPLLDAKLQEITDSVSALNQSTLDAALGSFVSTATLDDLLSERNIVDAVRLGEATSILQAQINLYPDLTNYVTTFDLEESIGIIGPSKLVSISKASTATFTETLTDLFYNNTGILTTISTLVFEKDLTIQMPYLYGQQNQLSEPVNKITIINDRTIIRESRNKPFWQGHLKEPKLFEFTGQGLEFSNDLTRYHRTLAQNTAFTLNADRPKNPMSPGVPGQMYVPNQYDILRDPYLYLCIDNSDSTKINDSPYHTNWVRIPVDSNYIGTLPIGPSLSSPADFPNYNGGGLLFRPSGVILYPSIWNLDRNFVFVRNQTYSASTATMIGMHLHRTGNFARWAGSVLAPEQTAPGGWVGSKNYPSAGDFTYTIRDTGNNLTTLPTGLSLTVRTIPEQSPIINMPIMENIADFDYAVSYTGTVFLLSGTPTAEFTSTFIFYLHCLDPNSFWTGSAWEQHEYRLPFQITVVNTTTGITVPLVPIG